MGIIGDVFGVPKNHKEEKKELEVVKAPEFDITQYAKKLAVGLPILAGGVAAGLKEFTKVDPTEPVIIAGLGVVAVMLFGLCLVMATDLAARAFITASEAEKKAAEDEKSEGDPAPSSEIVAASPGLVVWVKNADEPYPLLAIASDGGKASSYLVASGSKVAKKQDGTSVDAIGGAPEWQPADAIEAVRPAEWP